MSSSAMANTYFDPKPNKEFLNAQQSSFPSLNRSSTKGITHRSPLIERSLFGRTRDPIAKKHIMSYVEERLGDSIATSHQLRETHADSTVSRRIASSLLRFSFLVYCSLLWLFGIYGCGDLIKKSTFNPPNGKLLEYINSDSNIPLSRLFIVPPELSRVVRSMKWCYFLRYVLVST